MIATSRHANAEWTGVEDAAPGRALRVVLVGYYGFNNIGDDLMLAGLLDTLRREAPSCDVRVIVRPGVPILPQPAQTVFVSETLAGRVRRIATYAWADAVVWGGGTCLYEDGPGGVAGIESLLRSVRTCRLLRKPFHLLGVGIGTIHTERGRNLVRAILNGASGIYVRDQLSADKCLDICGRSPDLVMGDLAFLTGLCEITHPTEETSGPGTLAFCGVAGYACDETVIAACRSALRRALEMGFRDILFIPLHQGADSDRVFHEAVAAGLDQARVRHASHDSLEDCVSLLGGSRALIGMRLHSIVMADLLGLPSIALAYSPKVGAYLEKTGLLLSGRLFGLGDSIPEAALTDMIDGHAVYEEQRRAFIRREREDAAAGVLHMLDGMFS